MIEPFAADDHAVEKVCRTLNMSSSKATGGARFWWESNLKHGVRNEDYAAVVVDIPSDDDNLHGLLVRDVGYVEKQPVLSTYQFAEDGLLTITTRYDTNVGIERCWFVTDQVRMRVSSVQYMGGVSMTTYCTELRCHEEADIQKLAESAEALAAQSTVGALI